MPEIALSEASKDQLLEYAKTKMNLENVDGRSSADTLRTLIKEFGGPDTIPGEKAAKLPSPEDGRDYGIDFTKGRRVGPEEKKEDARFRYKSVTLTVSQQEGEQPILPIELNGVTIPIPRGKMCTIPRCYFEILQNAKYYRYSATEDNHGSSALGNRNETPRFPYAVHHYNPCE